MPSCYGAHRLTDAGEIATQNVINNNHQAGVANHHISPVTTKK